LTIAEVAQIVQGKVLAHADRLDMHVETAFGSDLMSDVLAFVRDKTRPKAVANASTNARPP